jgi:hypothetical protein
VNSSRQSQWQWSLLARSGDCRPVLKRDCGQRLEGPQAANAHESAADLTIAVKSAVMNPVCVTGTQRSPFFLATIEKIPNHAIREGTRCHRDKNFRT